MLPPSSLDCRHKRMAAYGRNFHGYESRALDEEIEV